MENAKHPIDEAKERQPASLPVGPAGGFFTLHQPRDSRGPTCLREEEEEDEEDEYLEIGANGLPYAMYPLPGSRYHIFPGETSLAT